MSIHIDRSINGTVKISIDGEFDFKLHRSFRKAYQVDSDALVSYIVDLSGASYMDSSALGMLMLLYENAGGDKKRIRIVNACPDLKHILDIANLKRFFDIS